ncbi:hypothetical protein D9M73_288480 [compost metagenome]
MYLRIPAVFEGRVQVAEVVGHAAVDSRYRAAVTLLLLETFRGHFVTAHNRLNRAATRQHRSHQ